MFIFETVFWMLIVVGLVLSLMAGLSWLVRRRQQQIARDIEALKASERPDYFSGIWCECHPPIGLHPKDLPFSETRIIQFK